MVKVQLKDESAESVGCTESDPFSAGHAERYYVQDGARCRQGATEGGKHSSRGSIGSGLPADVSSSTRNIVFSTLLCARRSFRASLQLHSAVQSVLHHPRVTGRSNHARPHPMVSRSDLEIS